MNIEIANRLVTLRRTHGLSQEELASRIGVSRQAVSKWERAEASPDTDNLILLARLYHVSLDELLSVSEPVSGEEAAPEEDSLPSEGSAPAEESAPVSAAGDLAAAGEGWDVPRRFRFASLPYPAIVTCIYLIIGFAFDWWHPGWVLFPTIPIYYAISDALDARR